MASTNSTFLNSEKHDAVPLVNSDSLKGFIKYIGILASCSESQFASTVLGEIAGQREQVHSKEEEVKELEMKLRRIEETKRTTIDDMFAVNEDEKAKQKASATRIESLLAAAEEKERKIAELSKSVVALQQEKGNLKLACSQEVAKVAQSAKENSTLQVELKERDKKLDSMKTAGSKLKSTLLSEQKRNEELQAANSSMNTELQAVRAHLQKLESFPVQFSEVNKNSV